MQLSHFLASVLAIGATAAPSPAVDKDVETRGWYDCGHDSYWGDGCCQCNDDKKVYNKHWGGCDYPNIEIDIQFGCYGGSYWDYHRGCCSCSNFNFFYYSENKSCNSCGDDAWYDYDNNQCKCNNDGWSWSSSDQCCYED